LRAVKLESARIGVTEDTMDENLSVQELLKLFEIIPARYAGREVEVAVSIDPKTRFSKTDVNECHALDLSPGETIEARVELQSPEIGGLQSVYATGQLAETLCRMEKQSRVLRVRARTVYGYIEPDLLGRRAEEFSGLLLLEILDDQSATGSRD
jgi:hypothetical protein